MEVARSAVCSADLVLKAVVYTEAAGKDLAAAVAAVAAARVAGTCERNPFHPLPSFGWSPNRPAAPCRTGSSFHPPSSCSCLVKPAAVATEMEDQMEAGEEREVAAWAEGRAEAAEVAEGRAEAAKDTVGRVKRVVAAVKAVVEWVVADWVVARAVAARVAARVEVEERVVAEWVVAVMAVAEWVVAVTAVVATVAAMAVEAKAAAVRAVVRAVEAREAVWVVATEGARAVAA